MKILIDTNVFLSAVIDNGQCHELILQAQAKYDIYYSEFILKELKHILLNKFKLNFIEIAGIFRIMEEYYIKGVSAKEVRHVSRDKNDDYILADALENNVDIIITGDKDLLILKTYEGIKILTPADFIKHYL